MSDVLVRVLPHFDVIAVQGIRAKNRGLLVRLVEQINALGRCYDFATDPVADRDGLAQYNAVLFDRASVEIDRSTVHFVEDPAGRFRYKPLVAAFRVRGPAQAEAFTFTLVNVQTDPDRVAAELDLLGIVYRAVRDDGRNEDDIILLGDLEADPEHLGNLGRVAQSGRGRDEPRPPPPAAPDWPTTSSSIAAPRSSLPAASGVFDLMRECDLSLQAALEISEHLPVWAEFSVYEGGQPGHVARAENGRRR